MPLSMYQCAYTADSLAAQINDPKDRIEVVRPVLEAADAKIVASGSRFGDYDVLALFEAPNDTATASIALAFGAGGAVKAAKTTKLLSGEEYVAALHRAQRLSPKYHPAR